MIHLKTGQEIEIMRQGGKILKDVMEELMPQIKPGITTNYIDKKAEELIIKKGAEPSFKRVPDYKWTVCVPINEQIVHTPPSDRILQEGDVLTVDIGVYYKGFHTDYADTVVVGGLKNKEVEKFLKVGKETLDKAIKQAIAGKHLGNISQTIQEQVEGNGYHIIPQLTGHGIGHDLHEDPYVFGYLDKPISRTMKIKPGLVIAIEIIYAMGTPDMKYEKDDWSIVTADKSIAACFEKTVAIQDKNTFILT